MQPAALICSLLLQIKKDPKVKNVLHYNDLIECLDLHLTEIDLIDYRGSTSEIKLARFFVLEASVLKVMRFDVLWRNNVSGEICLHEHLWGPSPFLVRRGGEVARRADRDDAPKGFTQLRAARMRKTLLLLSV